MLEWNAAKYCLLQVAGVALVAPIPATFIGVLKFAAEKVHGHTVSEALMPAIAFFLLTYVSITFLGSVFAISRLKKKLVSLGVSFGYMGALPKQQRLNFEKEHGL